MQYNLTTPVTREDLAPLRAGDTVLLSGVVYTARDAAHKRMMELLDAGQPLPFPIEGSAVYYVGPTPERPVIVGIMETIYYRTGDERWKTITKYWMTLFGVNFALYSISFLNFHTKSARKVIFRAPTVSPIYKRLE